MLDFRLTGGRVWPQHLRPIEDANGFKEAFSIWWERNKAEIEHIHPQLAEQWIYRHWAETEFAFLPLDSLTWELVTMSGEEVLASVRREISKQMDPDWDYNQFQGLNGFERSHTADDLDRGTWEYPIVALHTPSGWLTRDYRHPHEYVALPTERLMLLEGHQRHRYLNALHWRGTPPLGPHRVFIVRSPLVI